jgi:hypothetical protein
MATNAISDLFVFNSFSRESKQIEDFFPSEPVSSET